MDFTTKTLRSNQNLTGLFLLGIASISSFNPKATAEDACTLTAITQNCELFPSNQREIAFPNGGKIQNLAYVANEDAFQIELAKKENERLNSLVPFKKFLITSGISDLAIDDLKEMLKDDHPAFYGILQFGTDEVVRDEIKMNIHRPIAKTDPVQIPGYAEIKASELNSILIQTLGEEGKIELKKLAIEFFNLSEEIKRLRTFKEKTDRPKPLSSIERANLESLVADAKKLLIQMITKNESNPLLWTPIEAALVAKIKLVRITPSDSPKISLKKCMTPSAFFDPGDLSINICTPTARLPLATLISIIGHELFHAIDPCNAQRSVYKINKNAVAAERIANGSKRDNYGQQIGFLNVLIREYKADYTAYPLELSGASAETLNRLFSKGVLTEEAQGLLRFAGPNSLPINAIHTLYPFRNVYQCLMSPGGGEFRGYSEDQNKKIKDLTLLKERQNFITPRITEKEILDTLAAFPECVSMGKNSQMGEATADWFGTELLARYLQKHPPEASPLGKLSTVALFGDLGCRRRTETEKDMFDQMGGASDGEYKKTPNQILSIIFNNTKSDDDEHPGVVERADDIVFAHPEIRKALGCVDDADRKIQQACSM